MSLALAARIAGRELRGGLKGFRVFLACLALGVAAIAAVGSVRYSIGEGLEREGAAILGGDAEIGLTYRFAEPEERAWIEDTATEVSEIVDFRSLATADGVDERRRGLTQVKGVDAAYPLYGEVRLEPAMSLSEALAGKAGLPGAVMDPVLIGVLDIEVGDTIRLGTQDFVLSAALLREPDSAGGGFELGPRTIVLTDDLADSGLLSRRTLAGPPERSARGVGIRRSARRLSCPRRSRRARSGRCRGLGGGARLSRSEDRGRRHSADAWCGGLDDLSDIFYSGRGAGACGHCCGTGPRGRAADRVRAPDRRCAAGAGGLHRPPKAPGRSGALRRTGGPSLHPLAARPHRGGARRGPLPRCRGRSPHPAATALGRGDRCDPGSTRGHGGGLLRASRPDTGHGRRHSRGLRAAAARRRRHPPARPCPRPIARVPGPHDPAPRARRGRRTGQRGGIGRSFSRARPHRARRGGPD